MTRRFGDWFAEGASSMLDCSRNYEVRGLADCVTLREHSAYKASLTDEEVFIDAGLCILSLEALMVRHFPRRHPFIHIPTRVPIRLMRTYSIQTDDAVHPEEVCLRIRTQHR